jgi:hypothetical protein
MSMRQLIDEIVKKHRANGIILNPPVSAAEIIAFEKRIGFSLPADFKEFYSICNGFESNDDVIFNMSSLDDVFRPWTTYGEDWFYFSEYMINSELWKIKFVWLDKYEIIHESFDYEQVLSSSLYTFLERYLHGGVFGHDGLMDWSQELKRLG